MAATKKPTKKRKQNTKVKKHGQYEYTDITLSVRCSDESLVIKNYLTMLIQNFDAESSRILGGNLFENLQLGATRSLDAIENVNEYLEYLREYEEGLQQLKKLLSRQVAASPQAVTVKVPANTPMGGEDFSKMVTNKSKENNKIRKAEQEKLARAAEKEKG